MASLSDLVALIPAGGITRCQGTVVGTAAALALNVNGATIPYRCLDPLVVAVGDTVAVDLVYGATGQAEAWVIGRLTSSFRPATGTVKTVPPSSPSITVTGTDGVDYTAYFITSYTPVVGDNVDLSWAAAIPYVVGKVGATPAPSAPPPVAPPPAPSSSGTSTYPATDSGTWTPTYGAWDAWAGGGGNVYQGGSAYGAANYGAWFYGGSPEELSGRTVTQILFTLGSRRAVGNYNAAAAINVYAHTSLNKPGGDVSRVNGPYVANINPWSGQFTFALPTDWAGTLLAGGGIAIAGEPYAGFNGRNTEPASGLLQISWTR